MIVLYSSLKLLRLTLHFNGTANTLKNDGIYRDTVQLLISYTILLYDEPFHALNDVRTIQRNLTDFNVQFSLYQRNAQQSNVKERSRGKQIQKRR